MRFQTGILYLLLMVCSASFVFAAPSIPTVTILTPPTGANLTIGNGTTTSIVVIVNVSVNTTSNVSNVTVMIMNSANATILTIGQNTTISAVGNVTYNFTIVDANISERSPGIRNYTIRAEAVVTDAFSGLGNTSANVSNVNISIVGTAPTVTQNAPANATNQTSTSVTFNFTVSSVDYTTAAANDTYNFTCNVYSGATNTTTTNTTYRNSNASTIINASMTQKLHKWRVQCVDAFGIGANSSIRDLTVDATVPNNANITISSATINFGKAVTLTCKGADVISNTSNATISVEPAGMGGFRHAANSTTNNVSVSYTTTRVLGSYNANCTITDYTGNQNSSTVSFNVIRAPSDQGYVPSIEGRVATKIIGSGKTVDIGMLETKDSRLMAKTAKLIFTVNDEQHSIYVLDLTAESVTLFVESEQQEITIPVEETQEMDVNGDGVNDIAITLNGVFRGKADITVTILKNAPAVEEEPIPEE
ncbi:MAG: hypothetical protein AABX86_00540, partial [Nanoarchaeota archaeon]